ncbi:hypothetical protein HDV00_007286 [Rhizophlyctis rosea]|nr:hypothetical protein HDV00_007286 [Rhizophlyctis rosea]
MSGLHLAEPTHHYVTGTIGPICFGALSFSPPTSQFQTASLVRSRRKTLLLTTGDIDQVDARMILDAWCQGGERGLEEIVGGVLGLGSGQITYDHDHHDNEKVPSSSAEQSASPNGRKRIALSITGNVRGVAGFGDRVRVFGDGCHEEDIGDAVWCVFVACERTVSAVQDAIAVYVVERLKSTSSVPEILAGLRSVDDQLSSARFTALVGLNVFSGEDADGWRSRMRKEMWEALEGERQRALNQQPIIDPLPLELWGCIAKCLPFDRALWRLSACCRTLRSYLRPHRWRFLELSKDALLVRYHQKTLRQYVGDGAIATEEMDFLVGLIGLRLGKRRAYGSGEVWSGTRELDLITESDFFKRDFLLSDQLSAIAGENLLLVR